MKDSEIKFRLWHMETGAFLKVWPYEWIDGVYTNGKPNKYFDNKFKFSEDNKECNRIEGKSCFLTINGSIIGVLPINDLCHKSLDYSDEYIISQFTGRKDKNEKEIYSGDIIKDNVGRLWIVRYSNEDMSFLFHWLKDEKQCQLYRRFNKFQRPLEVIGNQFENPELL